jgi:hypothetical protein
MGHRRLVIVAALTLAPVLLVGCEEYATYTPSAADLTRIAEELPPGPTKDMIQGTAIARYVAAATAQSAIDSARATEQAARDELDRQVLAMTAEAEATITTQRNAQRATTQALDARATSQALDATATAYVRSGNATATRESRDATATAMAAIAQATATAGARSAQATVEARNATATRESGNATATMQAAVDAVAQTAQAAQAVMLEATADAVRRQSEREEAVQGARTAAPWVGLVLVVAALVTLAWYFAPVIKARASVVRRKHDESEPLVVTMERIVMPSRMFSPLLEVRTGTAPQIAPPDLQDRTTARTQLANVVSAARGASRRIIRRRPQAQASPSVIRVVKPEEVRPWLEDARAQLIAGGTADGDL